MPDEMLEVVRELPGLVRALTPEKIVYDYERDARRIKRSVQGRSVEDFPPAHRHAHLELCFALGGACPFLLGERRVQLTGGMAVVLSPDAFHCELAADHCGPYRLLWISCHDTRAILFIQDHLGNRAFNRAAPRITLKDFPHALQAAKDIDFELWATQLGFFLRVQGLLLGLCGWLERALADPVLRGARDEAVQRRRVETAAEYVRDHFSEQLDLGQVAAQVGVSAAYLSALFGRSLGHSFTDFLAARRIEEAERLLADPALSVKEIARRVGIQNPLYFSRFFRKKTGCSPSEYRARLRARRSD